MASKALDEQLPELADAWKGDKHDKWLCKDMLKEITSAEEGTDRRGTLLTALRDGRKVEL
jgi:hypothetical protein